MANCDITSITNPTSTSSFVAGSSVNVTWSDSGLGCNDWNVTQIVLQTNYQSNSWSNVSTLFTGLHRVTSNAKSVTLPSSGLNYGDYYRLKINYEQEEPEH